MEFVARFLASPSSTSSRHLAVASSDPGDAEFRVVSRYYNGSAYEDHHYHESLATWFREFRTLG